MVFWAAHEADSQTLGSESSGSAHSVQVGVRVLWHVKVEDYVDLLDVNTSSEDVSGDHDSVLEGFEVIVSLDSSLKFEILQKISLPFFLLKFSVNRNGREVLLSQDFV